MLRARGDQARPIAYDQAAISRRRNRHLDHFDVTGLQRLKDLLHANRVRYGKKGKLIGEVYLPSFISFNISSILISSNNFFRSLV